MEKVLEFDAVIVKKTDMDVAYMEVPFNIRTPFRKSRLLVYATFDGESYDGQVVKMDTLCRIVGIRKGIYSEIGKQPGDIVHTTFTKREGQKM